MTVWAVALDPPAAITGRMMLDLNSGVLAAQQAGIDWGDAAVQQYLAENRFGETAVSYRVPNRVVTIPMGLGMASVSGSEEEARRKLEQKIGLLQRQGGVLLRQREGAEPLYADIVDAVLNVPDVYGETADVEPGVVLRLSCLPDFYGDEIELDAVEQTGQIVQVLQQSAAQAVIAGDYPARARVVLTEKAKQNQKGLLWGVRSTHYDAASTAALFLDCYLLTKINGAEEDGPFEQPSYSGKGVTLGAGAIAPETWHPFLTTDIAAGAKPLTHIGNYRVWVRAKANGNLQQLRLSWSLDDATQPIINAAVSVEFVGNWALLDLGEISIAEPPVGEHWWRGILQVNTGPVAHPFSVDRIWLQPVDDGAGKLRATASPANSLIAPAKVPGEGASNNGLHAGTVWTNPKGPTAGESASVTLAGGASSQALVLTKLGFALPGAAVVKGIEVKAALEGGLFFIWRVQPVRAGALVGFSGNLGAGSTGGPADLWGTAWTGAQINEVGFGVAIWVEDLSAKGALYLLRSPVVTVYWAFAGVSYQEDAVLYSERLAQARFDGSWREDTTTTAYAPISEATGDLFRLPPSGLEGRAAELFVKNSQGLLVPAAGDPGKDKLQAQVFYRPCYLGRI